ncbi:hypothetical protein PIB30_025993 [Stylosanthes scabra]|uniref:Replication factor A C-terminal domain-containing protein n=1 Tax=Stylosanthes scabra TaxID=79078 RepID=A0ABU6UAL9_9FABA|nr:hypothetical protein [Stylosanthes scabra]
MSINSGMHDWSYIACKGCDKRVEEREGKYYCKKCNNDEPKVELRYKVEVVVCDGTGAISLLMWDTQGQNEEEYPDALNKMIGNRLMFRIYVKSGHVHGTDNVHSVANVCDDKEIIAFNLPNELEIGESDLEGENVKSNNVDGEGALVTTGDFEATDTSISAVGKRSSSTIKDGEHSTNRYIRKCLKRT